MARKSTAILGTLYFLISVLNANEAFAQYKVRLELDAAGFSGPVFLAGSFNNWSPSDSNFQMINKDGKIVFERENIKEGTYEFKFTKGSWNRVEVSPEGKDIVNRILKISSDTLIKYSVAAWRDSFPAAEKRNTASANVQLVDSAFYIPQLDRKRKIWIYLPPGYSAGTSRYPVIYMHDGQNLFNEATAGFGEWGVDEIMDSLIGIKKPAAIIVGVENGAKRLNEYNPYDNERFGKAEGSEYVNFLVNTLKPFIDKKYRTLSSKENTIIAGSSMGGLISYYAALRYPLVFGKAGVFSPSFWIAPEINGFTDSLAPASRGMFFFYMGAEEGENMMEKMDDVIYRLGKSSNALIYTITDPEGLHNENAWRKWFAEFYLWVTSNGLNHIVK